MNRRELIAGASLLATASVLPSMPAVAAYSPEVTRKLEVLRKISDMCDLFPRTLRMMPNCGHLVYESMSKYIISGDDLNVDRRMRSRFRGTRLPEMVPEYVELLYTRQVSIDGKYVGDW